jgi:hypothetical protein
MEHRQSEEDGDFALTQWSDAIVDLVESYATRLDRRIRRVLRERPLLSLLGAATFGCLLGRVLSRR